MVDSAQILLTVVVTALTVLLVIIGIQVFFILKEVQKTLSRVNKILDDVEVLAESVLKPVREASNFLSGLKKGTDIIKLVAGFFREEDNE
jgi:uncharacterized protein YoxC